MSVKISERVKRVSRRIVITFSTPSLVFFNTRQYKKRRPEKKERDKIKDGQGRQSERITFHLLCIIYSSEEFLPSLSLQKFRIFLFSCSEISLFAHILLPTFFLFTTIPSHLFHSSSSRRNRQRKYQNLEQQRNGEDSIGIVLENQQAEGTNSRCVRNCSRTLSSLSLTHPLILLLYFLSPSFLSHPLSVTIHLFSTRYTFQFTVQVQSVNSNGFPLFSFFNFFSRNRIEKKQNKIFIHL